MHVDNVFFGKRSVMGVFSLAKDLLWGGGGETMFYRQKIKGVLAYNTQNTL